MPSSSVKVDGIVNKSIRQQQSKQPQQRSFVTLKRTYSIIPIFRYLFFISDSGEAAWQDLSSKKKEIL